MRITVLMCNFWKYLPFINFWDKFYSKICCSPYLLKFSIEIRQTYISQNKLEEASQGNVFFYRFDRCSFAHKQVLTFCMHVYVYVFVFAATSKLPVLCTINCSMQFSENLMCLIRPKKEYMCLGLHAQKTRVGR